jgi:hypothetical protein
MDLTGGDHTSLAQKKKKREGNRVGWYVTSVGPVVKKRSGLPGENGPARDCLIPSFLIIFSTSISI